MTISSLVGLLVNAEWTPDEVFSLLDRILPCTAPVDEPIPLVPASEEECPPTLRSAEITPAPVARRHCIPVEVR